MTRPVTEFTAARLPLVALAGAIGMGVVLAGCAGTTQTSESDPASASRFAIVDGSRVPVPEIEMGDARTVSLILAEGRDRSRVMNHLTTITSEYGARLTASAALEGANKWAASRFRDWGLENVELFQWGEAGLRFDRGPSSGTAFVGSGEEASRTFEFTTLAWTRGTEGVERGPVVKMADVVSPEEAERYAGAWVLLSPEVDGRQGIRGITGQMNARRGVRERLRAEDASGGGLIGMDDAEHLRRFGGIWSGTITGLGLPEDGQAFSVRIDLTSAGRPALDAGATGLSVTAMETLGFEADVVRFSAPTPRGMFEYELTINGESLAGQGMFEGEPYEVSLTRESGVSEAGMASWLSERSLANVLAAGPLGFVSSSNDDRVWTSSVARGQELLELTMDDVAQDIEVNVRQSDYDYLNSKLADGIAVDVAFDLDHTLTSGPIPLYNTIGEIRGSEWPDEVVIVSAHLDSWNGPGSTGTVDNGTGSAVTIEAARILSEAIRRGGTPPERTIRFVLWTGEEQGLMGSRAYVATLSEEERSKISAAFVDDGGTNSEGGVPAADFMVDYLAAATAPTNGQFTSDEHAEWVLTDDEQWNDDGYINVNIRPTGDKIQTHSGSDHAAFNAVGVPGFFWDEVGRANYWEAWHTQNDTIDQAIPEYLRQSATNMAMTAYNLACAPGLLPREGASSEAAVDADSIETQIGVRE